LLGIATKNIPIPRFKTLYNNIGHAYGINCIVQKVPEERPIL